MVIRKLMTGWKGTEPSDIEEYLRALTAEGYPTDRFVHPACACGGTTLDLLAWNEDPEATYLSYPKRVCVACGAERLICHAREKWMKEVEWETIACRCRKKEFDVAVGFSHRGADAGELAGVVRWITVGTRCVACGLLSAPLDWKVGLARTKHLYRQA